LDQSIELVAVVDILIAADNTLIVFNRHKSSFLRLAACQTPYAQEARDLSHFTPIASRFQIASTISPIFPRSSQRA
ncbi:MAG TPA: hypothetical protein VMJ64_06625, partial [Anaerolineales bacterium]|nr:hypothetical protein [Anaerolineales bacterium]